jgi:hypothetical protein
LKKKKKDSRLIGGFQGVDVNHHIRCPIKKYCIQTAFKIFCGWKTIFRIRQTSSE